MEGFILRGFTEDGDLESIFIDVATIKYEPNYTFKINNQSVFNPAIRHRQEPFNQDKITVEVMLSPDKYIAIKSLITRGKDLYLDFAINKQLMQFPVILEKLPAMTDTGRFNDEKYVFVFNSTYTVNAFIDFSQAQGFGTKYGYWYGFS